MWSTSVTSESAQDIKKWLHSDACSGILFNLGGEIYLNDTRLSDKVIILPVSKQAQSITLPPGSQLVGVRFHPAISFAIFGRLYSHPRVIKAEEDTHLSLHSLCFTLENTQGHYARITALYRWLHKTMDAVKMIPNSLTQALNTIDSRKSLGALGEYVPLSQRQIERQFQRWMSMTPKYYQRIWRVKQTLHFLKYHPASELADLALKKGFTDQAHMTRECKHIARITPGKYSKQVMSIPKPL